MDRREEFPSKCFAEANPLNHPYYKLPINDGFVIYGSNVEGDNSELIGLSRTTINIVQNTDHYFHRNYIHRNQRKVLGYGLDSFSFLFL